VILPSLKQKLILQVKYTTHFPLSSKNHPYTVIHNLTPLEELEAFFSSSGTDFALGMSKGFRRKFRGKEADE
jgi:hypothetical protein